LPRGIGVGEEWRRNAYVEEKEGKLDKILNISCPWRG